MVTTCHVHVLYNRCQRATRDYGRFQQHLPNPEEVQKDVMITEWSLKSRTNPLYVPENVTVDCVVPWIFICTFLIDACTVFFTMILQLYFVYISHQECIIILLSFCDQHSLVPRPSHTHTHTHTHMVYLSRFITSPNRPGLPDFFGIEKHGKAWV